MTQKGAPMPNLLLTEVKNHSDLGTIKKTIKNGGKLNESDEIGTPLLHAILEQNEPLINLLLKHGASVKKLSKKESDLFFDLLPHMPNKKLQRKLLKVGLEQGLDINKQRKKLTPLIYAIKRKCFSFASLLLELGANPRLVPKGEQSPLYYATAYQHAGLIKKILKYHEPLNDKEYLSATLGYAIEQGDTQLFAKYMNDKKVTRLTDRSTYLDLLNIAFKKREIKIACHIQKTLNISPEELHLKQEMKKIFRKPYDKERKEDFINFLKIGGDDIIQQMSDSEKVQLITAAIKNGSIRIVKESRILKTFKLPPQQMQDLSCEIVLTQNYLTLNENIIFLKSMNIDFNLPNSQGKTILQIAFENKLSGETIEMLYRREAKIDFDIFQNDFKNTLLLHYAAKGYVTIVKMILASNISINPYDENGHSVLSTITRDSPLIQETLLEAGVDTTLFQTPEEIALEYGHKLGLKGQSIDGYHFARASMQQIFHWVIETIDDYIRNLENIEAPTNEREKWIAIRSIFSLSHDLILTDKKQACRTLLKQYKGTQPIVFVSGWNESMIPLVIAGNQLFLTNRINDKNETSGTQVFQLQKEISFEHLQKLYYSKNSTKSQFYDTLQELVSKTPRSSNFLKPIDTLPASSPLSPYCGYLNLVRSIEALLFTWFQRQNGELASLEDSKHLAKLAYKKLSFQRRNNHINELIRCMERSIGERKDFFCNLLKDIVIQTHLTTEMPEHELVRSRQIFFALPASHKEYLIKKHFGIALHLAPDMVLDTLKQSHMHGYIEHHKNKILKNAAQYGHIQLVEIMLAAGATTNLEQYVIKSHPEIAMLIFNATPQYHNITSLIDHPFLDAIEFNNVTLVQSMISHRVISLPLAERGVISMIRHGRINLIDELYGLFPKTYQPSYSQQEAHLLCAIHADSHDEVVKSCQAPGITSQDRTVALQHATECHHYHLIEPLLNAGVKLSDISPSMNPLINLIKDNDIQLIDQLLAQNPTQKQLDEAFVLAVDCLATKIAKKLLIKGANLHTYWNNFPAMISDQRKMALLNFFSERTLFEDSLITLAAKSGDIELLKWLEDKVHLELDYTEDRAILLRVINVPVKKCPWDTKLDIIRTLLNMRANPNHTGKNGIPALRLLLSKKMSLEAQLPIVKALVEGGAFIHEPGQDGISAWDIAKQKGATDILKYLQTASDKQLHTNFSSPQDNGPPPIAPTHIQPSPKKPRPYQPK